MAEKRPNIHHGDLLLRSAHSTVPGILTAYTHQLVSCILRILLFEEGYGTNMPFARYCQPIGPLGIIKLSVS